MNEDELELLSDDEKVNKIIERHGDLSEQYNLYLSLSTDELRLSVIDKINKSLLGFAVKDFKSDDTKIRALSLIDDEDIRYKIIDYAITSEEKKVEAMKLYIERSSLRFLILKSLSSETLKVENLYLVSDPYDKRIIIKKLNLDSDDKRIKIAKVVNDDNIASDIIIDIVDEEKKIEAINLINSEHCKAKIIGTLEKDEDKIEQLNKINNEFSKAEIIIKLKSDEKKIEQLDKLEEKYAKGKVLLSIKSDTLKLDKLHELNFTNELEIAEVLTSLESDILKIQELKKIKNDQAKAEIVSSLKDNSLKLQQLENIDVEINRARVIATIDDDNIKIEKLGKFENDFAKAAIIQSIDSDEKKVEELRKLENELAKVSVIIDLDDFSSREIALEEYQNLKSNLAKQLVAKATPNNPRNPIEPPLNNRELVKQEFLIDDRKYSSIDLPSKMTIGMEIESEGIMSKTINRLNMIFDKQDGDIIRGWETKGDGSLEDGVEVVSPILTDNQEDIEDVYMVCELMKRCGQTISEKCGGHIHIGADYLTSKEAYVNLFEIWGNCEEIIYKISNEKGNIPRTGINEFSSPISSKFNNAIEEGTINLESEEDLNSFIATIQDIQQDRYSGLNLLNINNGKNTIEFRISNGTINPDTWIENARLFGRMVQISQELAEIEKKRKSELKDKSYYN